MEVQGAVVPIDVIDVYLGQRVISILTQHSLEIKNYSISECDRSVKSRQKKKHTTANDSSALLGCTAASNASRRMLAGGASAKSLFPFFCCLHFLGSVLPGTALRFRTRADSFTVKSIHFIADPAVDVEGLEMSASRLTTRPRLRGSVEADLLAALFTVWKNELVKIHSFSRNKIIITFCVLRSVHFITDGDSFAELFVPWRQKR